MVTVTRCDKNPILLPDRGNPWESEAAFNPCVVKDRDIYRLFYRAVSIPQPYANITIPFSTIGYAQSVDGISFSKRRLLIRNEYEWERFGCEDPRVTKLDGKYYIFYTALSVYPFAAAGIKVGLALTKDLINIDQKHLVTTFNSKAMALFPEKINGKLTAILTTHTDLPPAKIAVAFLEKEEDLWSKEYWDNWYKSLEANTIPLQRTSHDHVEAGAPPVKLEAGWLLIYCYIYNYTSHPSTFAIEAVLLDLDNPLKVLARTRQPLLVPETHYELYGKVANVIFPSGAIIEGEILRIYYGASDTSCCLAQLKIKELLADLIPVEKSYSFTNGSNLLQAKRFSENPLLTPKKDHTWEAKYTFNPAAVYEDGKVHLLYRAMGEDNVSVLGYASSSDGLHIDERLPEPVFSPLEEFEKNDQGQNYGCEDPRLTRIQDRIYMCYTAYNGIDPPRVALTSVSLADFSSKRWQFDKRILISPPGKDDKDACIFPEKINEQYVFLHRFNPNIWLDFATDLSFGKGKYLSGSVLLEPRIYSWDSEKIGTGPPPIKTNEGWLLIYHGLSRYSKKYRLGAALLSLDDPSQVISRLDYPILEPETEQEKKGLRPDTVFACGAVLINGQIYIYYGAADQVVSAAQISLESLLTELNKYRL